MQRVLSFQMARGFGESSEFVTKRMCFSFLFSVGFLCLLCGFLLGRFASERSLEFRAEKKRLEFAGNGLEHTEHLQRLLFQKLGEASYETDWTTSTIEEKEIEKINEALSNLSVFKVNRNSSFVLATSHGSREPDRFVILSANGRGIGIALEIAKIFNQILSEYSWISRRTLIFCLYFDSYDICPTIVPNFIHHKVVAYITLYDDNLRGNGNFVFTASNLIKSMVLQDVTIINNLNFFESHNSFDVNNLMNLNTSLPYLAADIPHAAFSFVKKNSSASSISENNTSFKLYHIPLAQLVGDTVWRLSESLIFHWDPRYFNETITNVLGSISESEFFDIKDDIKKTIVQLISAIQDLNQRIDSTDASKPLDLRILNDLLMDLDRLLLCSNKYFQSMSLHGLSQQSNTLNYLNDLQKCYKAAIQLLQGW